MKINLNFSFGPLLAILAGCALTTQPAHAAPLTLNPGVSIYVSANEPEPVQRAARDLARDCRTVLGADSPIVTARPAQNGQSFIEVVGPDDDAVRADAKAEIAGHEAHGVFALPGHVVLQGADMRGTIYAIYTFSEKFLGVKPLWFWASEPPLPQKSIAIPENTDLRFAPPSVHWRAWFPNDTDLFTPWKNRSQANYDALYETMLRLKLNCVEGNVADDSSFKAPYPLGREVETARERGIAFVGHHIHPLGADYNQWDEFWRLIEHREPPKLSVKNVAELETFWRWNAQLAKRNNLEEIWLIGFRGNGDHPFWQDFADAPQSDKARADIITDMMRRQVAIVKEVTGNPAPVMRTTLYNELSNFYAQGLLRPLPEPNLIWTFVAARRDHYPAPDARNANLPPNQPIGYYFNFQFTSTGAHLAPAEGPWKMERNFRFINGIAPRPLEFSVVNMGNIREFVGEGSANADMMWNFQTFNSDQWLNQFCAQYFGAQNGDAVAALYRDFYNSYWQQRPTEMPGFERQFVFQDLRLNRALSQLVGELKKPNPMAPADFFKDNGTDANSRYFNINPAAGQTRLDALIEGTGTSTEKLASLVARAQTLMAQLPAPDQTFFNDDLLTRAQFLLATNQAAHNLALAVRDGDDKAAKTTHLNAAKTAATQMQSALLPAQHGPFAEWYQPERLFGINSHVNEINALTR